MFCCARLCSSSATCAMLTACLIMCFNKVSVVDASMSTLSAYFRTRPGWRQIANFAPFFPREASYLNKERENALATQQENTSEISVQETLEKSNAPQMSGIKPHHKTHTRQHRRHHGRKVVRDHAAALSKAIALEKMSMLTTTSAPGNVGKSRRRPYDHNCFFTPINCHPWQPQSEREPRN
ncbi:hypothetical protein Ddc_01553 [Ditylenchus destructor]|nr:hypothetical protein Ddc_01553 [Ditylenchus destructor]